MQSEIFHAAPAASEPELPPHPFAEILPLPTAQDYADLKRDMATAGQLDPIVTYQGQILDGRHRYKACRELGLNPVFREFAGSRLDALKYAISNNIHRRHLTEDQRAVYAVRLMPLVSAELDRTRRRRMARRPQGRTPGSRSPRVRPPTI